MSTVFSGAVAQNLKLTLDSVVTDKTDGVESGALFKKWMGVSNMSDQYEDDQEYGGPGLVSRKTEGAELATGTIREGFTKRYVAETFGLKLVITEEAIEDSKYPQVINAAKRLKRALWKTADIEATNHLVRMTDSNYVGGDGVVLASASHTLPHGGTWSNIMATPMSPSRAAVIVATTAVGKFPSQDGVVEGNTIKKVVCPLDQWAVWDVLTGSKMAPEAGEYNAINVVNSMGLEVIPIKYWDNTSTNYGFITDAEDGFKWKWKRKPRGRSWVDNGQELMLYSTSARWASGWSNARGFYGVNA